MAEKQARETPSQQSWWHTLPGVMTALAAVITAVTGLVTILVQSGWLQAEKAAPSAGAASSAISPPRSATPATPPPSASSVSPTQPGSLANSVPMTSNVTAPEPGRINLIATANGGQVLVATSDQWLKTIDGEEQSFAFHESNLGAKTEGVFAFKDERPARFDLFTLLITETKDSNPKEFELLWSNESPTGSFTSIGRFQATNAKLFKTPYQAFRFEPVTAKYFKVRLLSTWTYSLISASEFQLWGSLQ